MFHRFVYHIDLETEASKKFAYNVHGVHHDYPEGQTAPGYASDAKA